MKKLDRFSIGIGDRFGRQGQAQLAAFVQARQAGVDVVPVWNKSNREHNLIGTEPASVRAEADEAVRVLGWTASYHVDADHIGLKTVDRFLGASDFFTLDVADFIGQPAAPAEAAAFADRYRALVRKWTLPASGRTLDITRADLDRAGAKYAVATREAGAIYRYIAEAKKSGDFIAEVSMDETDEPQQPAELLIILAALAAEGVAAQTIAPKFSGRFNKGVDYVGDRARFRREFEDDVDVVALAVREFGLPSSLKLSVHSGSDKFSIYPAIAATILDRKAGLHLKTAGTTWLAEVEGLAGAGGDALALVKTLYSEMHGRIDELSKPYATVIDIDRALLPAPSEVVGWTPRQYVTALMHEPGTPGFNPHFRQLIHVGFKVAAEHGSAWLAALDAHRAVIGQIVTDNLYRRHLVPLLRLNA